MDWVTNMALHNGIRQSRVLCSFSKSLKLCSAPLSHHQISIDGRSKNNYKGNEEHGTNGKGNYTSWKDACKLAAAIGLTGFAVQNASPRNDLLAEVNIDQEIVDKENRYKISIVSNSIRGLNFLRINQLMSYDNILFFRIRVRQFSQITTIFDYFATYQIVNEKGNMDNVLILIA